MSYVRNVIQSAPKTLTEDEADRLLKVTGEHVDGYRDHVIFSVALSTALREHEIAALNVGDVLRAPLPAAARTSTRSSRSSSSVDIIRTRIQLRVFKRSAHEDAPHDPEDQQVYLPRLVRVKLAKFIDWKREHKEDLRPSAPLFLSRFRRRISTRQLRKCAAVWQRRAGFESLHPFHRLRHTSLSRLYWKTLDQRLVQRAARHRSPRSTAIYTHVTDEQLQRAIEKVHG